MDVLVADPSAACYGVQRALDMVHETLESTDEPVFTLGPLIHNPVVVSELAELGARAIDSLDEADGGTLVIRSHGVTKGEYEDAERRGFNIVNSTCPHVLRVQQAAARFAEEGRFVIIVGEQGHPEVEGILSHAGERAAVVLDVDEIPELEQGARVGVVVQTTQSPAKLAEIVETLEQRGTDLEVIDTICGATRKRQEAAARLAERADVMIVIGGRNSGNTRRLVEICEAKCPRTFHIETAAEIDPAWVDGAELVGISAGASTPRPHVDAVVAALRNIAR